MLKISHYNTVCFLRYTHNEIYEIYEMFVYKHTETIKHVKKIPYFLRKMVSHVNNSKHFRIFRMI